MKASKVFKDYNEGCVTQLDDEFVGQCIGKQEDVVFLPDVLEGERVRWAYADYSAQTKKQRRRRKSPPILQDILVSSAHRVAARCRVFGWCGGCSLQHIDATHQVFLKQQHVDKCLKETLTDVFESNLPWRDPILGDAFSYRRRARLSVRWMKQSGQIFIGFRGRNPRHVINAKRCEILPQSLGGHLGTMAIFLQQLHQRECIPQIEVSVGDIAQSLLIRHLKPLDEHDRSLLMFMGVYLSAHIYVQSGGLDTVKPLSEKPLDLFYEHPKHNVRLYFEPQHFLQINAKVNVSMVNKVIEWLALKSSDKVLDLFCGLGNFSIPMARYVEGVLALDFDKQLIHFANKNAVLNDLNNIVFNAVDLIGGVSKIEKKDDLEMCNKLILDPPRTGAGEILETLDLARFERIVYVSCNYKTLAHDLQYLLNQENVQFLLTDVLVLDMFPHTKHTEVMCCLKKI